MEYYSIVQMNQHPVHISIQEDGLIGENSLQKNGGNKRPYLILSTCTLRIRERDKVGVWD